jgi:HTH-type transcriptional regulator, sugar sensing transcriptional regulator
MNAKETLEEVGLFGKKADVYLATLELGGAPVTAISRKANIKRTTTYEILFELQKEGLISQTISKSKKIFFGEDPVKIKKDLERKKKLFDEILPQLKSIHNIKGSKPKILFYEGTDGMKELYEDTLKYSGELLALGSDDSVKMLGVEWVLSYIKRRVKKGIHCRTLAISSPVFDEHFMSKDQEQLRTTKYLNAKKYPFSIEINIYGHQKVFLLSAKDSIGVIIESFEIHNTLKAMFNMIWDSLPEIKVK